jgi:hypothetical protein
MAFEDNGFINSIISRYTVRQNVSSSSLFVQNNPLSLHEADKIRYIDRNLYFEKIMSYNDLSGMNYLSP